MPTNNDEIERLKRLREQQIRTRYDPDEKRAEYEQRVGKGKGINV